MSEPSTAMVLAPKSLDEALELAGLVAKSNLVPNALRRAEDAFIVLATGHELGLSPMQSLRGIHVIEGRPRLAADLMVALCLRRPDICRYFKLVKSTHDEATYETLRVGHGEPTQFTYTIDMAKQAGLLDKGRDEQARAQNNWRRNPAAMLRARASSSLAQAVYQDIVFGLDTDEEQLEDAPAIVAPPLRSTIVVEPAANPPPVEGAEELLGTPADPPPPDEDGRRADEPPASPVDTMRTRISLCLTVQQLQKLVPEIKQFEGKDLDDLRSLYDTRYRELVKEAARARR
jgi:hypothetical protein